MLTLHGSSLSNYYNKVKLALLEKGVAFAEMQAQTHSGDAAILAASPLGKIPFLKTEHGSLCESQVILEYIEATWPEPRMLPADRFEAAKVRELSTFIDWHMEMAARQLYGPAFFGSAPLSDGNQKRIHRQLAESVDAFRKLAGFAPYVAGASFTLADCSAFNSLPLVGLASKIVLGQDLLLAGGVDYKPYLKLVGARPSAQKVVADRKAAQAAI